MKYLLLPLCLFSFLNFSLAREVTVRLRVAANLADFPVILKARFKPISSTVWSLDGSGLVFNDKRLSNKNFVIKKSENKFDLVSLLDFDDYIAGVISKEMPLSWPEEALKAQAVVARSYALAKISERQNKSFHLDNSQMDQVFEITDSEKAKRAVLATDQIVLKDQNNKILKAYYHADCGGQTIPASKVWPGAIDSGTATDPWCQERKSNEWAFTLTTSNLPSVDWNSMAAKENFQGRIQSFQMLDQIISVQKLRQIFGYAVIKNSPTSFEKTEDEIKFKGKGFGHGVGLCQWGTLAQARLGKSYAQILAHYYPDAQLSENKQLLAKSLLADLVFN